MITFDDFKKIELKIAKVIEAEEVAVIKEEDTVFGNLKLGGTPTPPPAAKEKKIKAVKEVKEAEVVVLPKEEPKEAAPVEEQKAFSGFSDAALNAKLGL